MYLLTVQQTEVLPTPHVPSVLSSGLVLGRFFPHLVTMMRVDAKVVMLGKESVGKTSLVERYVHHRFLVGPYQNVSVSCSGYFFFLFCLIPSWMKNLFYVEVVVVKTEIISAATP